MRPARAHLIKAVWSIYIQAARMYFQDIAYSINIQAAFLLSRFQIRKERLSIGVGQCVTIRAKVQAEIGSSWLLTADQSKISSMFAKMTRDAFSSSRGWSLVNHTRTTLCKLSKKLSSDLINSKMASCRLRAFSGILCKASLSIRLPHV